jgi:GMP synthase (glutamine-hydrolysing)
MRYRESEEILENFKKAGFENIKSIDASQKFYERLVEIYEPEEKRKIIGQTFLDVKDDISRELNLNEDEWLLGQGTIYPDTIESGATKNADKIKTHHNRVDAIQKMIEKGLVVEPLVDFYKDEVRAIGKLLELPDELLERHPFPGPGLAIRCLCYEHKEVKEDLSEVKKNVADFYASNFPEINFELLPIRSVGVQGDNRTYAHPLVVWGEEDWKRLSSVSSKTTNSVRNVNRVIKLVNAEKENKFLLPKKNLYLSKDKIELLRIIDDIITKNIREAGIYNDIWQFPVVLVPVTADGEKESIVLRPLNSRDAMTLNFYEMESDLLKKITEEIMATGKISYVFYDITNKPPGTIEWE